MQNQFWNCEMIVVLSDLAVHFHHLTNIVLSEHLVSSHCLFWPLLIFFLNIPDDHIYTHYIYIYFKKRKL